MMNKGLEIIEAMRLFDLPESKIDAVVHPESVVHSMVEFFDNTVMAMMSVPDMRIPISRALGVAYSEYETTEKNRKNRGIEARRKGVVTREKGGIETFGTDSGFMRVKNPSSSLDLVKTASLTFFPPDLKRFPCLKIAREAAAAGGIMTAALSAANECAANDFLDGKIGFTDIAPRISAVLDLTKNFSPKSIGEILEGERNAKRIYGELGRRSPQTGNAVRT
jgi:1-deoxy-D-xylulose-5-phosphate reductoisomerase